MTLDVKQDYLAHENPAGWPREVIEVTRRFATCEHSTLSRKAAPITWPVTPYMGDDGRTIDVSTGLSYPAKAERARRNPRVTILFSDHVGSGLDPAPVVLVHALATVRDSDLQAGSDRYVRLNIKKFPEAYEGIPRFALKWMQWYYTRVWVHNTPVKVMVWPDGNTDVPPEIVWSAPEGTAAPPSDPAPATPGPSPWNSPAGDWRKGAAYVLKAHGLPVLTVVDLKSGFPLPFRVMGAALHPDGFELHVPRGMPAPPEGAACLTFHSHPEVFVGQENTAFVGEVSELPDGRAVFRVARQLGDFSLGQTKLATGLNMLKSTFKLHPHLKAELRRRGQPMPVVNVPGQS